MALANWPQRQARLMAEFSSRMIKLSLILLMGWLSSATPTIANDKLVVFAPASMTDVLGNIASEFEIKSEKGVSLSLAGTAQLARQLEHGAPANVFITADGDWMKWAVDRDLVDEKTVLPVAGNTLVVAVRNEIENWADIKALLTTSRFAMAEPSAVPAGRYAKQALVSLGIWEKASEQAVYGDNVRVTLRRLALGEVAAAIVYATDVEAEPDVKSIFTFSTDSHEAIIYWAALVSRSKSGSDFLGFLNLQSSAQAFKEFRFLSPPAEAQLRGEGN